MNTFLSCLVAFLAAAGLLSRCKHADSPPEAARVDGGSPPKPGEPFPSFSFADIEGRSLSWTSASATLETEGRSTNPTALVVHVFQPDCGACRDEAKALEALSRERSEIAIVGLAHRGEKSDVEALKREVGVSYPLAVATGTEWARTWGRGDPTYIVSRESRLSYVQTGFEAKDTLLWSEVAEDLAAGRAARASGSGRESLAVGEKLPTLEFASLVDGRPLRLGADSGELVFRDGDGHERRYRASVGFFSRF